MLTFNNRTALVTGAGRGIGKAIAETLAKHGVTVICVSKSPESCGAVASAIAAAIPEQSVLVLLDERGENIASQALALRLSRWRDQSIPCAVFVIGGADGLSPELAGKDKFRIAFGAATWPHQMVRVMLLEQLYRAATILSGHPYHRA